MAAGGSEGAKPKSPMGKEEAETPISERVSASRDEALLDAFAEDVDLSSSGSKSRARASGEIIDLRPSAEIVELVDDPSDANPGFDMPEPPALRETDPARPQRPPPVPTSEEHANSLPPVSM